jgi:hypothetical protein
MITLKLNNIYKFIIKIHINAKIHLIYQTFTEFLNIYL